MTATTPLEAESVQADSLAEAILAQLSDIRQMLMLTPAAVSIATVGPKLESIALDMRQLLACEEPPSRHQLREIHILSTRVQALYASAATFFGALGTEVSENNPSSVAAYSPSGDWHEPARNARIQVEG